MLFSEKTWHSKLSYSSNFVTPTFFQSKCASDKNTPYNECSKCRLVHVRTLSVSLVDSRVNDVLLQTIPDINEALLQLIEVVQTTFVHSLLHDFLYLTVDPVKVWAVGRPEVRIDEVGVSSYVAAYSEICEFSCSVFSKVS